MEENDCEIHLQQNVKRLSNGRFMVSLPLKESVKSLGESFDQAKKRLWALERKFLKNCLFKQMYVDFMMEYQTLGHMTGVESLDKNEIAYYMPQHKVLREQSVTTKLRSVFDASAPTTSGVSIQMVGCTLQSDHLSLLHRFGQYTYVVSADIAKMYRQVMLESSQRPLQRILWRANPWIQLRFTI
ncbi:hypothetical protein JTB14_022741 [Gonioctena quinquepunctata]|nr:hypothetical protein JTB14_022741 [Gonioctena quinquepunctata]